MKRTGIAHWGTLAAGAIAVLALVFFVARHALDSVQLRTRPGPTRIVFIGNFATEKSSEVFTMDPDGQQRTQLTWSPQDEQHAVWSPDGSYIVAQTFEWKAKRMGLFVMRADGTGRRRLTPPDIIAAFPAWLPDGRTIAFVGGPKSHQSDDASGILLIDLDGTNLRKLPIEPAGLPIWSPDGRRILWMKGGDKGEGLWVSDRNGKHLKRLVDAEEGAWSPDGRHVAFIRHTDSPSGASGMSLEIIQVDGSSRRLLATDLQLLGPVWSGDGSRIYFTRFGGEHPAIWSVKPDGKDARLVTEQGLTWGFGITGWSLVDISQ